MSRGGEVPVVFQYFVNYLVYGLFQGFKIMFAEAVFVLQGLIGQGVLNEDVRVKTLFVNPLFEELNKTLFKDRDIGVVLYKGSGEYLFKGGFIGKISIFKGVKHIKDFDGGYPDTGILEDYDEVEELSLYPVVVISFVECIHGVYAGLTAPRPLLYKEFLTVFFCKLNVLFVL